MNDTKQKLMEATRQLIDKDGINSVSMREIGNITHLSRSAVYRHFKCKEHLLSAIVVENFKHLNENILELINTKDEPVKMLNSLLDYYYDWGVQNRGQYQLMFEYEWNGEQYPDVSSAAFEVFDMVNNCIAKRQEEIAIVKIPSKELTAIVYSFIHGLIELNFAGHNEPEKGLNDPHILISIFINVIFIYCH